MFETELTIPSYSLMNELLKTLIKTMVCSFIYSVIIIRVYRSTYDCLGMKMAVCAFNFKWQRRNDLALWYSFKVLEISTVVEQRFADSYIASSTVDIALFVRLCNLAAEAVTSNHWKEWLLEVTSSWVGAVLSRSFFRAQSCINKRGSTGRS